MEAFFLCSPLLSECKELYYLLANIKFLSFTPLQEHRVCPKTVGQVFTRLGELWESVFRMIRRGVICFLILSVSEIAYRDLRNET